MTTMLRANLGPLFSGILTAKNVVDLEPSSYRLFGYPFDEDVAMRCEVLLTDAFGPGPHRRNQVRSTGSYAFMKDNILFGFARLQPSAKDPVGATWGMISSVAVKPKHCGLGRELMNAMERTALAQGYLYSCIWIDDDSVSGFYRKCGYSESEPASAASAVLTSPKTPDLGALNRLFQSKTPVHGQKCMRKRLVVKQAPTTNRWGNEDALSHEEELVRCELRIVYPATTLADWRFKVKPVPWERQIGPCCGLAAVRMVARFLKPDWEDCEDLLMKRAIQRGYTKDGEIFDLDHLALLCQEVVGGVRCQVRNLAEVDLLQGVEEFSKEPNALVILPYDKGSGSGYPELKHGMFAHYCVIVGVAQAKSVVALLARHGASSKLIAASKEDWVASNAQLLKRDTVRYKDDTDAIKLANRCIVVSML